jgi:hypothetical protein
MKIEVLSIDGLSLAAEAWRLSRDVSKAVQWSDIYTVDSPSGEMPSAFCHFSDFTILEREIFASSRTHVMWARTSFVDAADKFYLPDNLEKHVPSDSLDSIVMDMARRKMTGAHQDDWRRLLPISAATAFVMRLSFRDAIKYVKYFRYLSTVCTPVLVHRFTAIADALMARVVDQFTGSSAMSEKAAQLMSLSKLLHEGEVKATGSISSHGDGIIVASLSVPFWIRAHLVRHRPLTVADDLIALIKDPAVLMFSIDAKVNMTLAASDEVWVSLLGKRSCWLTQSTLGEEHDPWDVIINKFMGSLGEMILPCANGKCPYHRDARNRLEGSDPGVPCPRYLSLTGGDMTPHRARISAALASRGAYWRETYGPLVNHNRNHGETDDASRAAVSQAAEGASR